MKRDFNNIKNWLVPKLKERGISIEKMATATGLSRAVLYGYVEDKYRPSVEAMAMICEFLRVPLSEGLAQYSPRKNGRPLKRAGITSPITAPVTAQSPTQTQHEAPTEIQHAVAA